MQMLVILSIAAAVAAAGWWFHPHQRALRGLRSVPIVPITEAVEGSIVRIVGTLRERAPAIAGPLSGRACACYDVRIEERINRGKRTEWRALVRDTEAVDFVVEDATGRALVDARFGVDAVVVLDHHERSGFLNDVTPGLAALLARHGESATGFLGLNRTIRYREGVLEVGETVAVLGRARWEDDPDPAMLQSSRGSYRESQRHRRLVIEAPELGPVRVSDDPKALR